MPGLPNECGSGHFLKPCQGMHASHHRAEETPWSGALPQTGMERGQSQRGSTWPWAGTGVPLNVGRPLLLVLALRNETHILSHLCALISTPGNRESYNNTINSLQEKHTKKA